MKRINEDHKEINSGKKKDDEGYMARIELDSIERSIKNLRKVIKKSDTQLPAWVQSKITRAADYIDSATEYLQSDQDLDESAQRMKGTKGRILSGTETQIKKSSGAGALTKQAAQELGDKAEKLRQEKAKKVDLPRFSEETTLVDQILSEMGCGCDRKKKNKKLQQEEKDPKGPVQPYKTPEEIAKKHGVSLETIKAQLKMGMEVEKEHTSDETDARITALQHIDEVPNYYTKLKKVESQQESKIVRDMFGNVSYEFIDLISADPIISEGKKKKAKKMEGEDPCWKGYEMVGKKKKNGKEVPNCVPVSEAIMPQKNGHNMSVTLMWRAKYYNIQMFFPQLKIPNRREIADEANKVYPGCKVVTYSPCQIQSNVPVIQVPDKKSKNYLMNNGTIGEDWQKVNRNDNTDGMSQKAVNTYRRQNPGSKLKTAVTEPNPTGERKKRQKGYCSRSEGQKNMHNIDCSSTPDKPICKARKRWNCR